MKKKILFLALLVIVNHYSLVFGQNFYRSNSIGMVFEKILTYRTDEYDWIVEIREENTVELRIIFFKGAEFKRFEYLKDDDLLIISEYKNNDLIHIEKKKNGLVLKEENYENNVLLNEFIYEWSERRLSKTTYIENKLVIYEDQFILSEQGKIIQIRRIFDDGRLTTSGFSNIAKGKSHEWYGTEKEFILYKYENGKVVYIENWLNGIMSRSKIFTFSDSGSSVIEKDFLNGKVYEKIFDINDKILSEVIRNGNIVEKIQYLYNDNLLIQKDVAFSGSRERYIYEYDSVNRLHLEKLLRGDMLIKEVFFEQGKKILEKIYKNNSLILVVTYKNGDKIGEEQIQ